VTGTAKPLLEALSGKTVKPAPIWLMRQAGRYLPEYRALRGQVSGFLELCFTPDLATEVTLQPIRRFGLDAAILFSDILVVPHGLGRVVRFVEGEGPVVESAGTSLPDQAHDLDAFHAALAPVYQTVAQVRAALPPEVALIGFAGAPWTVAAYMVEGGSSRDWMAARCLAGQDDPGFQTLIDVLVERTAAYLCRQVEAGAEALQLFDSWAGNLPACLFQRYIIEPNRAIVARVKAAHPTVPIIGFPRAAGINYEAYAAATGVDAVSCDPSLPVSYIRTALQSRLTVQGNLDPAYLVMGGAPLVREIRNIVTELGAGPFVFNLGHGIVPATPPDHVAELVAAVRNAP